LKKTNEDIEKKSKIDTKNKKTKGNKKKTDNGIEETKKNINNKKVKESKENRNNKKSKRKIDNEEINDVEQDIRYINKNKNKILKFVENFVYIIMVCIALIFIVPRFTNNNYSFLGIRIYIVATGSMIPKYEIKDVLVYRDIDAKKIKVGDDILYRDTNGYVQGIKDALITHQVVQIDEDETGKRIIHTKGIANSAEDPVVSEEQVVAKVLYKSSVLTYLINSLNNKYIFYFIGIIPLTIIFFFGFMKAGYKNKK
jgi:signal peptidase I